MLHRLRKNPWADREFVEHVFEMSLHIAKRDQSKGLHFLAALEHPLAVYYSETSRRSTALLIASNRDPKLGAEYLDTYEPNVIWSEMYLELRNAVYQKIDHRLAATAKRDLDTFRRNEEED